MFHLEISAAVGKDFAAGLRAKILAAHALLDPKLRELSIALVNDRTMSDLHFQFVGIAGPTDVLTFPLDADRAGNPIAGEVVICVPAARRAAKMHGTSVKNELLLYAVHGMLHLSGFDDRTDRAYRRMHKTEDEILTQLGVGRVFDRSDERRGERAMKRITQRRGIRL